MNLRIINQRHIRLIIIQRTVNYVSLGYVNELLTSPYRNILTYLLTYYDYRQNYLVHVISQVPTRKPSYR